MAGGLESGWHAARRIRVDEREERQVQAVGMGAVQTDCIILESG